LVVSRPAWAAYGSVVKTWLERSSSKKSWLVVDLVAADVHLEMDVDGAAHVPAGRSSGR